MLSLSNTKVNERSDIDDKKRNISIYYYITTILGCNTFTPKTAKASDFNKS